MALTQKQVSELFVSIFGRASEGSGNKFWQQSVDTKSAANDMLKTDAAKAYFGNSLDSNQAFIEAIYKNTLNKTVADDAAGIKFWVDALNSGMSRGEVVASLVASVASHANSTDPKTKAAYDQFNNRVEVSNYVADKIENVPANGDLSVFKAYNNNTTNDVATKNAQIVKVDADVEAANVGTTFQLKDGRDTITGTDGNDTFYAEVGQNQDGALANAFSTGDVIDGKGGSKDTLEAAIMGDNGVDNVENFAINAKTTNVEIAKFTALDENVTVDAGRMDSVEEFWSNDSDNVTLTIEDVRLGSKLSITDDLSFGMQSVDFKSDLIAELDSQSFVKDADDKLNSQIVIEVGDSNKPANSTNPLELIELKINFTFGGQVYSLDLKSADGTYEGLKTAVEEKLAANGLTGLNVTYGTELREITAANDTVPLLYSGAKQIIITDPAGTEFTKFTSGVGAKPSAQSSNPVSNTTANAPQSSTPLIETNILLDDAGRSSTAGDFEVNGMSNSGKGIQKFDVYVDRDSSIASLTSNGRDLRDNGGLDYRVQEIEINSKDFDNDANTTATGSLEIGELNDGIKLIEADAFKGTALMLGTTSEGVGTAVNNLVQLDASIAGDVTFVGQTSEDDGVSSGNNYDYDTGSGKDTVTFTLDGDSVDALGESFALNAGNGDNTVKVDMQGSGAAGAGVSVATTQWLNNLSITTGTGADKVELVGGNTGIKEVTTVTLGALAASQTYIIDGVTITDQGAGSSAAQLAAFIAGGVDANLVASGSLVTTTVSVNTTTNVATYTAINAGTFTDLAVTGTGAGTQTLVKTTEGALSTLDGDADFNISTGAASDFVYINSINDAATAGAAKGTWTVGATSTTGVDFGDAYTGAAGINGKVLYKATLTINFAGFEQKVTIDTTNANNFVATQTDINNAIKKAIAANPELSKLLTTTDGTGHQQLTIKSTVEGLNQLSIAVNQPALGAVAAGAVVAISSTDILALQKGLISTGEATSSTVVTDTTEALTIAKIADVIDGTGSNGANAITVGANGAAGGNLLAADDGGSANETAVTNVSVIDLGKGANDLVVLNSEVESVNTVKFSAAWDKVSVVNFENAGNIANGDAIGKHKLDFTAFLGNQTDASVANGNTLSAKTIATKVTVDNVLEVDGNDVLVLNNFAETSATVGTWAGLTAANLLAAIQETNIGAANYGSIVETTLENDNVKANLIGTTIKSIVMIENDKNDGEYKVFELTAKEDAGTVNGDFTAATLIGIIDFGDTVVLADANLV